MIGIALAIPTCAIAAGAQDTTQAEGQRDAENQVTDLHKVEVTAKRQLANDSGGALGNRTELDTPFSLSTVDAEEIKDRQAISLNTVFATDASVTTAGNDYNGWSSSLVVRGLPLDSHESIKLNGMPAGFYFGANLPLEVMDQVQLLKGAAGFMYGFGAPGGIINYATKKPTEEDVFGFDVGYRSDSLYSEHVDIGGRLFDDERFGYRLNASHEQGESVTGSNVRRTALALSLEAHLTPALTWTADVIAQDKHVDRPVPYYSILTSSYASARLPVAPSGDDNPASEQSQLDNNFYYLSSGIDWKFADGWSLAIDASKVSSKFRLSQEYMYLLNEQGDYQNRTFDGLNIYSTEYAQAMVQGSFGTGPIDHEIVVGASWERRLGNNGLTNYLPGTVVRNTGNIYAPVGLVWSPYLGDPPDYRTSDTVQKAFFASDTLTYGQWSLLAGLRYTDYTQDYADSYALAADGGIQINNARYAKSVVTPTAALLYKPVPEATLYASYVESLEQGSTVGNTYANAGQLLDPLLSKQYELGFKWDRPGWGASAALFRIDRGAEYVDATNTYVQDGLKRYDGLEMAGDLRLGERLKLGASAIWLDASYEQTSVDWLVGQPPEGTAHFLATLQADYQMAAVPGLSLHADAKYWDRTLVYNNTVLNVGVYAPGYVVFNAGASYRMQVGTHALTLRAEVQNLFDREYWQGGSYNFTVGAPRTLALNLAFDL